MLLTLGGDSYHTEKSRNMTCQEVTTEEKSLSLNRLFSISQTKAKKKMKKGGKKEDEETESNCEVVENTQTVDVSTNYDGDDERNNNRLSKSKMKQTQVNSLQPEAACSTEKNTINVNKRTLADSSRETYSKEDIFSILFEAIQYKDIDMLHRVGNLYPAMNINKLNEDGIAVIHFAAMVGSTIAIEPLLKYGADIDLKDIRGNTPLHYAYIMKRFEFADTALHLGANINLLNKKDVSKLKKFLSKLSNGS